MHQEHSKIRMTWGKLTISIIDIDVNRPNIFYSFSYLNTFLWSYLILYLFSKDIKPRNSDSSKDLPADNDFNVLIFVLMLVWRVDLIFAEGS